VSQAKPWDSLFALQAPVLGDVVRYVVAFLLALVVPASAAGQAPSRDTTAAAPVKDLPLTAAQRQVFVGKYSVTMPHGEQTTLRVFEENGQLKGSRRTSRGQRCGCSIKATTCSGRRDCRTSSSRSCSRMAVRRGLPVARRTG
jgi:hypothetical protein